MSATPTTTLQQVQALLREGKVQEADDLAAKGIADEAAAAAAAAGAPAPAPPPRTMPEVLIDLFTAIVAHLGNIDSHEKLLAELRAVIGAL